MQVEKNVWAVSHSGVIQLPPPSQRLMKVPATHFPFCLILSNSLSHLQNGQVYHLPTLVNSHSVRFPSSFWLRTSS